MIVAITGGTGFIGKKLVARLLGRGDTVRLLTRHSRMPDATPSSVEIHECNLLTAGIDELSAMLDGVDVLYHCAGQLNDTNTMRALHVDATRKLTEAASGRIGHWVQLSSVGVYGPVAKGAITEDSVPNPAGEYEVTKTESDLVVVEAATKSAFSYSILRPSNVFGAGMANQSLPSMIAIIDHGLFFYIGKPGASANYIHVDNVIGGLISCGTVPQAKGAIYNISDHCTMEHFVEVISATLGRSPPWLRLPEPAAYLAGMTLGRIPGFPLTRSRVDALTNRSVYPILRIQRELGYCHAVSMEEGLREMVWEYKQRRQHIVS